MTSFQHIPATVVPAASSLGSHVWKLLRLRLFLMVSSVRRGSRKNKIGLAVLGSIAVAVIILVFIGSRWILRFMSSPQLTELVPDAPLFLAAVPVLILIAVFVIVLISSFGMLLQALYLSGDMDFLLSAPIPTRAVFTAKLFQAVVPNFSLFALIAIPLLFGLGAASDYNIFFYPLALILMAALALAASGIASLLVMGTVRIFPARRVAEVLAFTGAVISVLCSQIGYLTQSFTSESLSRGAAGPIGLITQLNNPLFPLSWPGLALVMIGESRWVGGIGLTSVTLIAAGGVFFLTLAVSERLYHSGWAGMQSVQKMKKKAAPNGVISTFFTRLLKPFEGLVSGPVKSLVMKDYRVIRRDLRNFSQVITPLIFGVIYSFMLIRSGGEPPLGRGEAPEWFEKTIRNASFYASTGIALFVSWTLLSRLAMMSFSQEGRSFWIIKSAPVSSWQILTAKFLVAFLPALTLAWIFLTTLSLMQRAALVVFMFGLAVTGLCTAAITGINLAFGAAGANLDWDEPRQMIKSRIGCLGGFISLATLPLALALFLGPPILFPFFGISDQIGQLTGIVLGGSASLICAYLPLRLIQRKVDRLGE